MAELGVELAPDVWGRYGYALEIGRALLAFGLGELGLHEVVGATVSANARVARLVAWYGADVEAERAGAPWLAAHGWHEVVWRVTRAAWEARGG